MYQQTWPPAVDQLAERAPPGIEAADRVQHDAHFDAGAGPLGERLDEPRRDLALLKDVGFQADVALGRADCRRVPPRRSVAVGEHLDARVGMRLRIGKDPQHSREIRGLDPAIGRRADPIGQCRPEKRQNENQQLERNARHGKNKKEGLHRRGCPIV